MIINENWKEIQKNTTFFIQNTGTREVFLSTDKNPDNLITIPNGESIELPQGTYFLRTAIGNSTIAMTNSTKIGTYADFSNYPVSNSWNSITLTQVLQVQNTGNKIVYISTNENIEDAIVLEPLSVLTLVADTYNIITSLGVSTLVSFGSVSGGGGGVVDYILLSNKPQLNGEELVGNKPLTRYGIASVADVFNEITARETEDGKLEDAIDKEILDRENADGILQDNIDALTNTVLTIQNNLDTEQTVRETEDASLQSEIDAITARLNTPTPVINGSLYLGAGNTLSVNVPTVQTNYPLTVAGSTPATVNFSYTFTDATYSTKDITYSLDMVLLGLSQNNTYTATIRWRVATTTVVDVVYPFTARATNDYLSIPINRNELTAQLDIPAGATGQLSITLQKTGGSTQTINIATIPTYPLTFKRFGGAVTTSNVVYIDGKSQTTVNNELYTGIDNLTVEDVRLENRLNRIYPSQLYNDASDTNVMKELSASNIVCRAFVRENNGEVSSVADNNICYTDEYIPVLPSSSYIVYIGDGSGNQPYAHSGALYNENKVYTRGITKIYGTGTGSCLYTLFESTVYEKFMRINIDKQRPERWLCSEVVNNTPFENLVEGVYLDNTGAEVQNANMACSDFIEVTTNPYFYSAGSVTNNGVCCYDIDKNFISRTAITGTLKGTVITLPAETQYVRVNLDMLEPTLQAFYEILAGAKFIYIPLEITVDNLNTQIKASTACGIWKGKKANFLGDSITAGSGTTKIYWQYIQEYLGLSVARNYGQGGTRISGAYTGGTPPAITSFTNRYANMDNDANLIFVLGGTNDFGHQETAPMGTIADRTDISFYGALYVLCDGLINKYPTATIIFGTPAPRTPFASHCSLDGLRVKNNTTGLYLDQYVNAIKEVCAWFAIPVVDFNSGVGFQPNIAVQKTELVPDGLHPNALGHENMARYAMLQL